MNLQKTLNRQDNLPKNKAGGITVPVFKLCYKVIVINAVWHQAKEKKKSIYMYQWNRLESSEINPHTYCQFSSVQWLIHAQLFVTPWTAAHQASLSNTNSQSLFKLMSIEWVIPSNHLILLCPLLLLPSILPRIRSFPISQFFASDDQSIGASASTSVLLLNIQD